MKKVTIQQIGLYYLAVTCFVSSCHNAATPTIPVEHINPTSSQQTRRERSEQYCKAHNIPLYTNPNALFIDQDDSINIRTKDEIVDRAFALCYIAMKGDGASKNALDSVNKGCNVFPKMSREEKVYALTSNPAKQGDVDAGWRYEDLHVLLWALGYIDSLDYPDHECDVEYDLAILRGFSSAQFRQKAVLRPKKEILDQADLILRIDWACVDAKENKKKVPGNLNGG